MTPAELDVRPMLATGGEPFAAIMAAVRSLAPGQGLVLLCPFKPMPLLKVMSEKGFDAEMVEQGDGSWRVVFTPMHEWTKAVADPADPLTWPDPARHLDLLQEDLSAVPAIVLEEVSAMRPGQVLYVALSDSSESVAALVQSAGHFSYAQKLDGATQMMILVGQKP